MTSADGTGRAVGYLTFSGEDGVEVPESFLAETIALENLEMSTVGGGIWQEN